MCKRENGGFALETHQTFSVHTMPEKFLDLRLRKSRAGKSHDYLCIQKILFLKMFSVHTKTQGQQFQIPPV